MTLPTNLLELCNEGYVTLGPEGRIVRFSTAKMMDRPVAGMIRESVEITFCDARLMEDDVENTENAALNMNDAMDAVDDLIEAGFQVDIVSGLMMMSVFDGKPFIEPAAYATVWRDVKTETEGDALWVEVEEIVKPWGGDVHVAGADVPGQAPHWHIVPELAQRPELAPRAA